VCSFFAKQRAKQSLHGGAKIFFQKIGFCHNIFIFLLYNKRYNRFAIRKVPRSKTARTSPRIFEQEEGWKDNEKNTFSALSPLGVFNLFVNGGSVAAGCRNSHP
jgi:hypothetical protein